MTKFFTHNGGPASPVGQLFSYEGKERKEWERIEGIPQNYRVNRNAVINFTAINPITNMNVAKVQALVNPSSLKESLNANYSIREPLGLSHGIPQYINTSTREIAFELFISWQIYQQLKKDKVISDLEGFPYIYRNFFYGLLVPFQSKAAPAKVKVDWNSMRLNFTGVLKSVNASYTQFAQNGMPMEYTLDLAFVEIVDADLMTFDQVYRNGLGGNPIEKGRPVPVQFLPEEIGAA